MARLMCVVLMCLPMAGMACGQTVVEEGTLRIGMVGLTTSHVPAFAKTLNAADANGPVAAVQVTDAVVGGMPDNEYGWPRREKFTDALRSMGVTIHDSMEAMLPHVDAVMVMSVDGRPHLEYARKAFEAGKNVYIDKPMAASLADVITIFRLAEEHDVAVFSSSSLRYSSGFQAARAGSVESAKGTSPVGKVLGCDAFSPCSYEPHHPDLFWYGVHGVETLFTIMGSGCVSVQRTHTDSTDFVVGVWEDGRIGTFRGTRSGPHSYGAFVYGEDGEQMAGSYEGYAPLCVEIAKFFQTGVAPVDAEETIEIFAFMEAADQSKRNGGAVVDLEEVIAKAQQAGRASESAEEK